MDAPLVLFERFRGVFLVFQLSFREYAQRFFFRLHWRRLAGTAKPLLLQQGNHLFQIPDFFQKKPQGFLQVLDVGILLLFCHWLPFQQLGNAGFDFLHGSLPQDF